MPNLFDNWADANLYLLLLVIDSVTNWNLLKILVTNFLTQVKKVQKSSNLVTLFTHW